MASVLTTMQANIFDDVSPIVIRDSPVEGDFRYPDPVLPGTTSVPDWAYLNLTVCMNDDSACFLLVLTDK
jgi:hypothetical protein